MNEPSGVINRIDNTRINPYRTKDFKDHTLIVEQDDLTVTGVIKSSITGEFGNRKAYISTGYECDEDTTNYFIVSEPELVKLIEQLQNILDQISSDKEIKSKELELMTELHSYIDKGYIKSITLRKLNIEIPGFDKEFYKVFNVEPEFNNGLPNDGINRGFNFVKIFRLAISKADYENELKALVNGKNIPIKFIGFDRNKQIKDYIKEAKDSLKGYDPSKRRPPTKQEVSKALKVLSDIK